jgi:hypothetical protein
MWLKDLLMMKDVSEMLSVIRNGKFDLRRLRAASTWCSGSELVYDILAFYQHPKTYLLIPEITKRDLDFANMKVDPCNTGDFSYPLQLSMMFKNDNMTKALIDSRADVNTGIAKGSSVIQECCESLVRMGVDPINPLRVKTLWYKVYIGVDIGARWNKTYKDVSIRNPAFQAASSIIDIIVRYMIDVSSCHHMELILTDRYRATCWH